MYPWQGLMTQMFGKEHQETLLHPLLAKNSCAMRVGVKSIYLRSKVKPSTAWHREHIRSAFTMNMQDSSKLQLRGQEQRIWINLRHKREKMNPPVSLLTISNLKWIPPCQATESTGGQGRIQGLHCHWKVVSQIIRVALWQGGGWSVSFEMITKNEVQEF